MEECGFVYLSPSLDLIVFEDCLMTVMPLLLHQLEHGVLNLRRLTQQQSLRHRFVGQRDVERDEEQDV